MREETSKPERDQRRMEMHTPVKRDYEGKLVIAGY